jgi:alanine-synthesizing transaminase
VHYLCDEQSGWNPDIKDMEAKITSKTKGIVVINPNNPTGAVYSREILRKIVELAEKHELIIFADEIYDHIVYDDAEHIPIASCPAMFFLSRWAAYQIPSDSGFRADGW